MTFPIIKGNQFFSVKSSLAIFVRVAGGGEKKALFCFYLLVERMLTLMANIC